MKSLRSEKKILALIKHIAESRANLPEITLGIGEDYSLILSASQSEAEFLVKKITEATGLRASVAGKFSKKKEWYVIITPSGKRKAFTANGWDHLSGFLF